jgi:hypothetical protein
MGINDRVCQGTSHKNSQLIDMMAINKMDLRLSAVAGLCIDILNGAMIVPK